MELNQLFAGCRTYRRFEQTPIEDRILREMIENARISSCAGNQQALSYFVARTPEKVKAMQPLVAWAAMLPKEVGTPIEGEQPTVFIAIAKKRKANAFTDIDVGIAANTLALTAWAHGIGSCLMASLKRDAIQSLLSIPEDQELRLVVALGYPSHKSTIVDLPEDGSVKYYVDENRDYYVPKRKAEDISHFL